jgi:hypothetical protein
MKTHIKYFLTIGLLSIVTLVFSQVKKEKDNRNAFQKSSKSTIRILYLDLAELDPGQTITVTGNNNYKKIVLKNVIIDSSYSISIVTNNNPIEPLDFLSGVVKTATVAGIPTGCDTLVDAYNNLRNLFNPKANVNRSEKEVRKRINELQKLLLTTNCDNGEINASSKSLINECTRDISQSVSINEGETLTIIVSCGNGARKWTWKFIGDKIGEWVMSYGFGFTSAALEGKKYHLQQMDDTTTFKINQNAKPGTLDLSYIPAIFYSFLPASKYNRSNNWSITAGLGFDLSAPVVFFGGGFMFRQNIGINAGIAFQQQSKLFPQYSDGQILTSSIQDSQLHDKVYRPNLFISINFRFDKSRNSEIKDAMKPK